MADHVPDFEFDFPPSTRGERASVEDEGVMELLWQNGQMVAQSQNHRQSKKSTVAGDAEVLPQQQSSNGREIPSVDVGTLPSQPQPQNEQHRQQFFMQEAEMASWLYYPLDEYSLDREIYSDILDNSLPAPIASNALASSPQEIRNSTTEVRPSPPSLPPPVPIQSTSVATRPPVAPPPRLPDVVVATPNFQNFMNFSRIPRSRMESGQPSSIKAVRESTIVESNDTPMVRQESRLSLAAGSSAQPSCRNVESLGASTSTAPREFATTCDRALTLSPGGSGDSFSASVEPTPRLHKPTLCSTDDRKRKERELDDADRHSEDLEFESAEAKKLARESASGKKSRAAEVHNLSERRRRDRINEKMRTLQELIPRCNKADKASMLDEAIGYLKSLQWQVQMMSMGCGMVPMMYPGLQQYMPTMGAGMGMGMDMGGNQPIMPYPPHFPGSGFPLPGAANMAPRFAMPGFQLQAIPVPSTARMQASSQPDPMLNSQNAQGPNQPRMPGFMDPYQQFIGLHHTQLPVQSQVVVQPCSTRPSCDRAAGRPENNKTG